MGVKWVIPKSYKSLLLQIFDLYENSTKTKKTTVMWRCKIGEILWVIWCERNDRIFEETQMIAIMLWENILFLTFL